MSRTRVRSDGAVEIEMLEGVTDVPRDDWNALVGSESPFLEWDWLTSLEHANAVGGETGWLPRPLVARRDAKLIAACPLYIKDHSEGEFVFDWGWADAAQRAGLRYYPKMLVGVPFTPVSGARFLSAAGEDHAALSSLLGAALRRTCASGGLSSVHVNFCLAHEIEAVTGRADGEDENGYMLRVGFQYHWRNQGYTRFDDYLAQFRSKRRNQIRRERRAMEEQGVTIEALAGDEIPDSLIEPMYRCYLSTIESRYWGRQYLSLGFFELLLDRFRDRLCFIVARREGELIAGTTNIAKGDALYGRYWGALSPARHLHFNVCYYAAIEFCIAHGLKRFEPGAGGDYKYLRGFDPEPTFSLHYLRDPRLAHAVGRFLEAERHEAAAVIAQLRQQSALKSTTGAAETSIRGG